MQGRRIHPSSYSVFGIPELDKEIVVRGTPSLFSHAGLWGANYQSSGDRRLEEASTVSCPAIFGEVGPWRRRPAGSLCGRRAE